VKVVSVASSMCANSEGGGDSRGHVICCSGRSACSSGGGGVGYSCIIPSWPTLLYGIVRLKAQAFQRDVKPANIVQNIQRVACDNCT